MHKRLTIVIIGMLENNTAPEALIIQGPFPGVFHMTLNKWNKLLVFQKP